MKSHYEISLTGASHVAEGKGCQDAAAAIEHGDCVILAVADGVGSQQHSEIGAKVAVNTCVETCDRLIDRCDSKRTRLDLLRTAFAQAYTAVLDEADERDLPAGEMDCTLCCVIWDSAAKRAFVGQSGDSGAVCSGADGRYRLMTEKQNDLDGAVYCLCFDDRWEFHEEEDVWSVMLCTDGVLDRIVAPAALRMVADNPSCNAGRLVDTRMTHAFLHPFLDPSEKNPVAGLRSRAEEFLAEYDPVALYDDKTVAVAFVSDELPSFMPDPYYEGPDWPLVEAEYDRLLYSHEENTHDPEASGSPMTVGGDEEPTVASIDGNTAEAAAAAKRVPSRTGGSVTPSPAFPDGDIRGVGCGAPATRSEDSSTNQAGYKRMGVLSDEAERSCQADLPTLGDTRCAVDHGRGLRSSSAPSGEQLSAALADGVAVGSKVAVIVAEETCTGAARLFKRVKGVLSQKHGDKKAGQPKPHPRKGQDAVKRDGHGQRSKSANDRSLDRSSHLPRRP